MGVVWSPIIHTQETRNTVAKALTWKSEKLGLKAQFCHFSWVCWFTCVPACSVVKWDGLNTCALVFLESIPITSQILIIRPLTMYGPTYVYVRVVPVLHWEAESMFCQYFETWGPHVFVQLWFKEVCFILFWFLKVLIIAGMVANAFNPCAWETEASSSLWVQGQSWLQSESLSQRYLFHTDFHMRIMLMRISVADGNALETTASSSEAPFNAQLHPYSFGGDKPQECPLCSEELPCGSIDSTTDTLWLVGMKREAIASNSGNHLGW